MRKRHFWERIMGETEFETPTARKAQIYLFDNFNAFIRLLLWLVLNQSLQNDSTTKSKSIEKVSGIDE